MKKKLNSVYALLFTCIASYLFLSYSFNPPNGYTGAPPSFNTCASTAGGCHTSGSGMGNITITGLPPTISTNTTYPITVTVTRTNGVPQLGGFQLVALNSSNQNTGMLSNPGPSSTVESSGGRTYFEHNPAQFFGPDFVTYTVDWTSPSSGTGTITMYAAGNLANGVNGNSGDVIVTTTVSGTLQGGGGGPITVNVTGTNISCFGGNNGMATANPTGGGGPPYSYMWSNGATTQTITNLTAGMYSVTVTNGVGGSGVGSINITQPSSPVSVSITNQINISCFNPIGSATAQAIGGVGNFSYNWSNGNSGPTAIFSNPGAYTVTTTDGNNCTATATVSISANVTPPNAEAGPIMQVSCANQTATLNGSGSSTGGNISYLWTTTDGHIVSGANTLNPVVNEGGTYHLTVSNSTNGCTASDNTNVSENFQMPNSNAGADTSVSCAVTTVELDGTASLGMSITYQWTTSNGHIVSGANTSTPVVDEGGAYCLQVTNATNGCTDSDCAVVSENTMPPVADAGATSFLTCADTTVTLDGSGSSSGSGYSYLWATVNGNIVNGDSTTMPEVNAEGLYILTVVSGQNGCTASDSVLVELDIEPPVAEAGPGMALNCNNSFVVLNGSNSSQGANFSYNWSGPGIQSGGNTPNPTVNEAGTYLIAVANTENGCVASDSTSVVQTPALTASIANQDNVSCHGQSTGSATAEAAGGNGSYSFAWSNGDSTAQAINLAAGNYTVTITDADTCTATASVTITQPPMLNAVASATGETSFGANDGTATSQPSGGLPGYTYVWSNGDTTQTITGLVPGNYTVTVTDGSGCTAAQTVTVSTFSCANLSLDFSTESPSCNGESNGSVTVIPVGGSAPYIFIWSNGDTTATSTGLPAGIFSVTVTDGSDCELTGNVMLTAPSVLSASVTQQTNVACNGGSTGSATIEASGGTADYSYDWSNGGAGATQNDLVAGAYSVTVTDANGCTTTVQVSITQPQVLDGNITATDETAVNANDGTATASVSGGTPPYDYLWNNGETTAAISGLSPGEYCVTVTDANGCTFTNCASVISFDCGLGSTAINSVNVSCFGGDDGSATVVASGFTPPFAFDWSNGGSSAAIGNLEAGIYTYTLTDANGCIAGGEVEITEPDELVVELLGLSNAVCDGQSGGSISVNGIGGTPDFSFMWSNGSIESAAGNLASGIYEVTVTDANDCTATLEIEIGVDGDIEAPVVLTQNITVALDENGMATIAPGMVDGGSTDNCGIDLLSLDIADFSCDNLGENQVKLTATDEAGNSSSETVLVTVVDTILPVITCPPSMDLTGCALVVNYPEPVADDNCSIDEIMFFSGLTSGSVFPEGETDVVWYATDEQGNLASCTFTVTLTSNLSATSAFTQPTCFGLADGTATVTPAGGTLPFSYKWDDTAGQTTQTATGLAAGVYNVTVSDAGGCDFPTSVEVAQPAPVQITVDQVVDETHSNMAGAISITATGGTGSLFFDWFYNEAPFSQEEDISGLSAGEYVLQVTDLNGCTDTDTIFVDNLLAVSGSDLDTRILLYPNPSSGKLFLKMEMPQSSEAGIGLFDLSGKQVLPEIRETVLQKTFTLDLSGKSSGVYLLRIIVEGTVVVRRVILD